MRIVFVIMALCSLASLSHAASYHWVDREGFHAVDQLARVPREHRKDLPMARNLTALPFTEEEDRDGAMYVWFILGQSGYDYPFTKAADVPSSPFFRRVQGPVGANIAWWKGFVALYEGKQGALLVARGKASLRAEEKKRGRVAWYRFVGSSAPKLPPAEKTPRSALEAADEALLRLPGAMTFPPKVQNDTERDQLREKLREVIAVLLRLRKRYPDDPQVLRLLGVSYRMGFNLGVPGAWERAEAYLLRTEALAPKSPEAYISLGILYADTGNGHAALAERQFRSALRNAHDAQLPQIWWGLALALYQQGKVREAVATIDRLIARYPDDARAKKARETFLEGEKGRER